MTTIICEYLLKENINEIYVKLKKYFVINYVRNIIRDNLEKFIKKMLNANK